MALPYINRNPAATDDEIRIGTFLDQQAQAGNLPGVNRVEGAAEIPNERSGDYRFIDSKGNRTSADLVQPLIGTTRNIWNAVTAKSGQAIIVIVDLGTARGPLALDEDIMKVAQVAVDPASGLSIQRIIVITGDIVMMDVLR